MKIAIPSHGDMLDDHFGHCEAFTVFTVGDKKDITSKEMVPSPAGCGCKSNIASILAEMGVTTLLAGNMGQGAVNVLQSQGIAVVRGCSGRVEDVARQWLDGTLSDSQTVCASHGHDCQSHQH